MRQEHRRFLIKWDKVQQAEPTENIEDKVGKIYAILFNPRYELRADVLDMNRVYEGLIEHGIKDETIYALEGQGPLYSPRGKNSFIKDPATKGSLEKTIDRIKDTITRDDIFLFYVTNHGKLIDGKVTFNLHDGKIDEIEFKNMSKGINSNYSLYFFATCHGGGFAERLGYGNNIIVAACGRSEIAWMNKKIGHYFTKPFFKALFKDRKSIEKAFEAAAKATLLDRLRHRIYRRVNKELEPYKATPQLRWQNADPSKLYLGKKL